MKRYLLPLFLAIATTISATELPTQSTKFLELPLLLKGKKDRLDTKIRELVRSSNWVKLRSVGRKAIKSKLITLSSLERIALQEGSSGLQEIVVGAKGLVALKKSANISPAAAFSLSSFIIQELPRYVAKKISYFDPKKYDLEREVQLDREFGTIYIHLRTHGVKKLGEGFEKVVTRTVKFGPTSSVVMALAETTSNIHNEIVTMRRLLGKPGVLNAAAFLKIPRKSGTTTAIVTPIFNAGSLQDVLDKKITLTPVEKLIIARDLTQGLASMQEIGYAHRDIGARNHFVHIGPGKPGKRLIQAVVADFGRSRHYRDLKGSKVQGNTTYISPEGYFMSKMKGKDYLKADVFGLGCTLWQLVFGQKTPWGASREYRYGHGPMYVRKNRFTYILTAVTNKAKKDLNKVKDKAQKTVISTILKMVEVKPSHRGTAKQHLKTFNALLTN